MFYITVSNGLLEPKHRQRMQINQKTSCVWVYLWLLDKVTKIDLETGLGSVLGGKPIKIEEVAEIYSYDRKTVEKILKHLEKEGYIQTRRTPYGKSIFVTKAKKTFGRKVEENGVSDSNKTGYLGKENGVSNKTIQLDKTVDTVAGSDTPFSLKEEIHKLEDNSRRDLNIIALYLEHRKPDLQNKAQYQEAIKRHLRPAKTLIPFTDEQILKALDYCKKEYKDIYTIETLSKVLTK